MKKQKPQILFIHGGMTFKNHKDYINYLKNRQIRPNGYKSWSKEYLKKNLRNCDIIRPEMPNRENAKYDEWKIYFERYFPYLNNNIILIGNSLGSIFLAKYLSENKFPKKILSLYLVCAPFDNTIIGEDLVGGFKLKSDLKLIEKQCNKITLMFSKDDDIVPISHAEKYRNKLKSAKILIYKSKNGHFKISKFPEIIKMIKQDIKAI